MDDIEKMLERLNSLERSINDLKNELQDLKDHTDDLQSDESRDSVRNAFTMFNDIYNLAHDLKRQMRRTFRSSRRHRHYYDYNKDFDFDFDFDLNNLGDFISNTVSSALAGLENITDSIDFDFSPKMARIKIAPGTNIRFDKESSVNADVLPVIDDIQHAKEILTALQSSIASLESLSSQLELDASTLAQSLDQLKERKLVIQEKYGSQRFMVTKLGKKVLKNQDENKNGEETN